MMHVINFILIAVNLVFFGGIAVNAVISQNELNSFTNRLWSLDEMEMRKYTDYSMNVQGKLRYMDTNSDMAAQPLFSTVDMQKLLQKPTIRAFVNLLDNYNEHVGVDETSTPQEEAEINEFIDELLETDVMKETHLFLQGEGLSPPKPDAFKSQLKSLWFQFYRRQSNSDSSPFEHVFVGETRGDSVLGYHNWIKFALDEMKARVDYRGFIKKSCGNPPRLISLSFRTKGNALKPMGSMFIGTSPEFEMALYTVYFLTGFHDRRLTLGACNAGITCHSMGKDRMGSCFVKA